LEAKVFDLGWLEWVSMKAICLRLMMLCHGLAQIRRGMAVSARPPGEAQGAAQSDGGVDCSRGTVVLAIAYRQLCIIQADGAGLHVDRN
jgi:hypothetical protein